MMSEAFNTFEFIKVEDRGGRRLVTIDRAAKANAMNRKAMSELFAVVTATSQDRSVRVFALTGAGGKVFCGGADLSEAQQEASGSAAAKSYDKAWDDLTAHIAALPCMTVAILNGACVGGGLSLALAFDFRYAASHAFFRYPVARHGFLCSRDDLERLVALSGSSTARRLLLLGEDIPLPQALVSGLADGALEDADPWTSFEAFASRAEQGAVASQLAIKRLLASGCSSEMVETSYRAVYDDDREAFDKLWES